MGTAFTKVTGVAAPFIEDGIDTDVIFPARFLLLMEKGILGRHLFQDRRYGPNGEVIADFVLNKPQFENATILISRENFGGGSSREHAVWSLAEYGFRCVIACGFGEIFAANCIRNGVLPARVDRAAVEKLAAEADGRAFTVDLEAKTITLPSGDKVAFEITESDRAALLNGWDDIDQILALESDAIKAYEARKSKIYPWVFGDLK